MNNQNQSKNVKKPMNNRGMITSNEKAKDFKGTIKQLIKYLNIYKIGFVTIIIFAIGSTIFSIVGPKLLGRATTEIFNGLIEKITGVSNGGINFDKIGYILLVLFILYIISTIFSLIQNLITSNISQKLSYKLRKEISLKINRMPIKYFEKKATGDILSRITNDVDTLSQNLNYGLTQVISSFILIIGVLIMMITISPIMTLASLVILPISIGGIGLIVKKSQKYFDEQQEYLGHINSQVEEIYGGHDIVKVFNGEKNAINTFNEINNVLYNSAWKSQFLSRLMMPLMKFVGNIGYVVISVLGGYLVIKNKIEVGSILSFSQYIRSFTQPITQIAQVANLMQSMVAAAERVFEFLNEEEETQKRNNYVSINNIKGNVIFNNVKFCYDQNQIIINNFNAKIKSGQKIAIVGPTGAGKTTIVKLLMRFYDVNNGEILIDNHNVKDFNRNELRNIFGMVLQDTWLFNDTIKENIRYGKLNATDEEVIEAAKAAHIDHYIKTLPESYDMILNEETNNISEGQKQLLTIARVILANPKILILDEATSSVDTRTEILIQKSMDELMKGRTSFIIAHRLSTIKNADLILVMNNGDIIEQGKHCELLAKNGFYAKLYNSQFEEIKNI